MTMKKRHFNDGGDASGNSDGSSGGVDNGSQDGASGSLGGYSSESGHDPGNYGYSGLSAGKPGESAQAQAAAQRQDMSPEDYSGLQRAMVEATKGQNSNGINAGLGIALGPLINAGLGIALGPLGGLVGKMGLGSLIGDSLKGASIMGTPYGSAVSDNASSGPVAGGGGGDHGTSATPFGESAPAQTTPAVAAAATGMRQYVWNPQKRTFELTSVGAGENPMGYQQGQTFQMAAGGQAPSGLAAALPARFVKGGGTGLSDSIPVKMDDGSDGRLANEEFVIPADVVSGLGGGSSEAGAKILYGMMERIRKMAHGSSQQIRPVEPGKALPA